MMDPFTIPDGYYVLREDVNNPKPDRRMTRSVIAGPVWKKGMRIKVKTYPHISPRPQVSVYQSEERFDHHNGQVAALIPNLEPADPKLGQKLDRGNGTNFEAALALTLMVERGIVTLDQVDKFVEEVLNLEDDAYDDLRQRHWMSNY
jgi:hypothetical protein